MNLTGFTVVAGASVLAWWLSGYDAGVTGENPAADFRRRALRCGATLLLVVVIPFVGWLFFAVFVLLGIIWAGCLSEFFARGFHSLVDSEDDRDFDPKQRTRDLDKLAELVHTGRNQEAVAWCRKLSESGEASELAMETMLFRLYSEIFADDRPQNSPPLAEARRLREQRHFSEAEAKLNLLFAREPENLAAALMLLRLYAQDLQRPAKADALLQAIGRQPHVPPAFLEFARRSVAGWSGREPRREKTSEGIESLLVDQKHSPPPRNVSEPVAASVDELLATGHLATAIEILESQTRAQPGNFDLWLKLAEAHAVYCGNVLRAGKIVEKMAANSAFDPRQIQHAKAQLNAWRAGSR